MTEECGTCGIGFRLPSGRCDHCDGVDGWRQSSPMDIAKRNRWSEQIAQQIARDYMRWTENGAFLDIQRTAAVIRSVRAMQSPFGAADVRRLQDWLGVTGSVMADESWDKLDDKTRRLYVLEIIKLACE
jgi:hypothetical protein